MSIPSAVRTAIKDKLWAEADRLDWSAMSANDKSRYYTMWTENKDIGGKLGVYMDPRQVRVYIKDSLLKSYTRDALADNQQAFRVLDIPLNSLVRENYIKPHGRLLADGRQIAWSRASDWKATLMALFERAFGGGTAHAAVFLDAKAKFATADDRRLVEDAARKLGIERVVWLD